MEITRKTQLLAKIMKSYLQTIFKKNHTLVDHYEVLQEFTKQLCCMLKTCEKTKESVELLNTLNGYGLVNFGNSLITSFSDNTINNYCTCVYSLCSYISGDSSYELIDKLSDINDYLSKYI